MVQQEPFLSTRRRVSLFYQTKSPFCKVEVQTLLALLSTHFPFKMKVLAPSPSLPDDKQASTYINWRHLVPYRQDLLSNQWLISFRTYNRPFSFRTVSQVLIQKADLVLTVFTPPSQLWYLPKLYHAAWRIFSISSDAESWQELRQPQLFKLPIWNTQVTLATWCPRQISRKDCFH